MPKYLLTRGFSVLAELLVNRCNHF